MSRVCVARRDAGQPTLFTGHDWRAVVPFGEGIDPDIVGGGPVGREIQRDGAGGAGQRQDGQAEQTSAEPRGNFMQVSSPIPYAVGHSKGLRRRGQQLTQSFSDRKARGEVQPSAGAGDIGVGMADIADALRPELGGEGAPGDFAQGVQ